MPDQDDPQIPLSLAAAMADFLTRNATFRAGLSDAYRKAVQEHLWPVNKDGVARAVKAACGTEFKDETVARRIDQIVEDKGLKVPYHSGNRSRRSAIYATLYFRLTRTEKTDPILRRLHNACGEVLTKWPENAATPETDRFLDVAMALSDWVNVYPLFNDYPALRPAADLRLAMVLNDEDTRDILAPAVFLARAMAQFDASASANRIIGARAGLEAYIRSISPKALRPRMKAAISAQIRKGGPELCDRLLAGEWLARSEVGRLTGLSPRQQSRIIGKLTKTGWVMSDGEKGPLRLGIPCS